MAERVVIRELVVKLLFEGSESGVTKFNQALSLFKQLAGAAEVAVRALTDAVVGSSLEIAREGDAVAKHAKQVGLAVEEYDRLSTAIGFAGGESADIDIGIRTLTRNLEAFVRTGKGEAEAAFKAFLGPDARTILRDLDSIGDALPLLADGYAAIEDPIARAAYLQRVFGESGGKLIPLLEGGAAGLREYGLDADRAGVFSERLAASSEALQDNLLRLSLRGRGLKIAIGEQTVPALVELTDELVRILDAAREVFGPDVRGGAMALAWAFRVARDAAKSLREYLLESERAVAALKTALIFLGAVLTIVGLQMLWISRFALERLIQATIAYGLESAIAGGRALLAWAKAAAPVVLLAALITAIVLLIEDLVVGVEGGESAFKRWTTSMIDAGGASQVLGESLSWLFQGGLGNDLYDLGEWLSAWLSDFGTALSLLPGEMRDAFVSLFDWLTGRLSAVGDYLRELFRLPEWLTSGLSRVGGAFSSPAAAVGGGRSNNIQVGGSSVAVQVSGAGDPRAVGAEVARQTDAAMSRHATRVARDLGSAMAY